MKQQILFALPLIGAAVARPTLAVQRREVPQEHAHRNIINIVNEVLQLNNPDNIQDAIFGLLGAAAAAEGAGDIADADCLQQATADQAFTNAKEAGDVDGLTAALIFRALERNTGSVGLESVLCESIQAVNPEIAALTQHQDPAGEGAQELNKQIAAELARQIASIGGDPLLANEASTFEPGELGDPTAAGNTCNDPEDDAGCINSLGLRVDDLSEEEILAAVEDVAGGAADAEEEDQANVNVGGNKAVQQVGGLDGCNAGIVFGIPSDGRQDNAFEPADLSLFSHGSALNIDIISSFICQQISNKCSVGASVASSCNAAQQAAQGLVGAAAANAFNSILGL